MLEGVWRGGEGRWPGPFALAPTDEINKTFLLISLELLMSSPESFVAHILRGKREGDT